MLIRVLEVQTVDDRGNGCALVKPPDNRKEWAALKARDNQAAKIEKSLGAKIGGSFGALIGFTMFVPHMILSAMFTLPSTWPGWASTIVIPATVGVLYWPFLPVVSRTLRRRQTDAIKNAYRLSGCCASCGYDINNLSAAEDGLTVCPECGCSWRMDMPDLATQGRESDASQTPVKAWQLMLVAGTALFAGLVLWAIAGTSAGIFAVVAGAFFGALICFILEEFRPADRRSVDGE